MVWPRRGPVWAPQPGRSAPSRPLCPSILAARVQPHGAMSWAATASLGPLRLGDLDPGPRLPRREMGFWPPSLPGRAVRVSLNQTLRTLDRIVRSVQLFRKQRVLGSNPSVGSTPLHGSARGGLAELAGHFDALSTTFQQTLPGARGYPSFHGVASLCHLQGPLRSLRRPHFYSGLRTPPDHALRTVEPMKPWPSSSTRPRHSASVHS